LPRPHFHEVMGLFFIIIMEVRSYEDG
jgi:hypothetical protein